MVRLTFTAFVSLSGWAFGGTVFGVRGSIIGFLIGLICGLKVDLSSFRFTCLTLPLLILLIVPQQLPKRFQCKVDTDGESIKLVQCQHEDEEDMVEGGFNFLNFPDKWKPALSHAQSGEGTAHFTETAKEVCLRQVRPLDGFIRHPVQEDLNLCQRKSKGWRTKRTEQYVNLDR